MIQVRSSYLPRIVKRWVKPAASCLPEVSMTPWMGTSGTCIQPPSARPPGLVSVVPSYRRTWAVCLSAGERVPGGRPVSAGQLSIRGRGVGRVCRVRSGPAEHPTLPPVPHPVHHTGHSGLQRPWERLLHGAAQR